MLLSSTAISQLLIKHSSALKPASPPTNHTETSLQELKRARPDLAVNFYEFLSRYLCERVLNTTKSLRILAD